MIKMIKAGARRLISASVGVMGRTSIGRFVYDEITSNTMNQAQEIEHAGMKFTFSIPNSLNRFRAGTFSTKEPETLEWIDSMPRGSVVWDIGANVGLYTCYAGKARGCRVFAFEPSVFNLELLARNIFLNGLTDQATIVPLPLSEQLAISKLNMTTTSWGGAMSTFGQTFGHDGREMPKVFEFPMIGVSMVDAIDLLKIPQPDYIKMDVDGIEHLILKGGMPIVRKATGILIEINDNFSAQANDASMYLRSAGFALKEKRHADFLDTGMSKYTFNQIWVK